MNPTQFALLPIGLVLVLAVIAGRWGDEWRAITFYVGIILVIASAFTIQIVAKLRKGNRNS